MKRTNVSVMIMRNDNIDFDKDCYDNVSSIGIHKDFTSIGYTDDEGRVEVVNIDHADNVYISTIICTDEYSVKRMLEEV